VILRVWDRDTGSIVAEALTPEATEEAFFRSQFTPDGRRLVITYFVEVGGDITSHLDVLDATTLQPADGPPLPLNGIANWVSFTQDASRAVVGLTHPGTEAPAEGLVVDLAERRVVRSIPLEELHGIASSSVGASGRVLGFSDGDGKLVIADAATGEKSPVLQAYEGFGVGISFAPDEATFVTSGSDGTIKLWDTDTHQLLGAVQRLGPNRSFVKATFVDESRVLIYYPTGEIFEWDPRPDAWEAYACRVAGRNLTKAEWAELVPDRPYRSTCPDYPPGT
jgi:hypothetical protein